MIFELIKRINIFLECVWRRINTNNDDHISYDRMFSEYKKWEGKYEYEYKIIMFKYSYRIMNRIRSIKIDMNENKMKDIWNY